MSTASMNRRESWRLGYEYSETIADGATGDSLIVTPISAKNNRITCCVIAGAGSGKIQTTISSDAKITAGTATWIDWYKGNVSGTDCDVIIGPVSGIRGVSVSGEIKIEVLT